MNVKKPEGYDFPLNLYRTLCFELDSDARLPEEITPDEKKGFKYLIGSMRNDEYKVVFLEAYQFSLVYTLLRHLNNVCAFAFCQKRTR